MAKYKLCLYYSSRVYYPIIDKVFDSIEEIDKITLNYQDEIKFRDSKEFGGRINSTMATIWKYISEIKSDNDKNGKIVIVKNDGKAISYIKPLYQCSKELSSPKVLINSIIKILKNEKNNKLLSNYLYKFDYVFNTDYNKNKGFLRKRKELRNSTCQIPNTINQEKKYSDLIKLVSDSLKIPYNKETNSLSEEKYFTYRIMIDYLTYKTKKDVYLNSKVLTNKNPMKLNREESKKYSKEIININKEKKLSQEEIFNKMHSQFINRVINDAYLRGEEPSLLDITRDEYQKDLEIIEGYLNSKKMEKK